MIIDPGISLMCYNLFVSKSSPNILLWYLQKSVESFVPPKIDCYQIMSIVSKKAYVFKYFSDFSCKKWILLHIKIFNNIAFSQNGGIGKCGIHLLPHHNWTTKQPSFRTAWKLAELQLGNEWRNHIRLIGGVETQKQVGTTRTCGV